MNIKIISNSIVYVTFVFLLSCSSVGKKNSALSKDEFIQRYEKEDFSILTNVFIAVRNENTNKTIYMVQKFDGDFPVYFVTYNNLTERIININREQLLKAEVRDYFSTDQISEYISFFRQFDFCLLGVDADSNVFINPYYCQSPPYFLRLNNHSNEKTIDEGYLYGHFNGNWYINKRFIEND